MTSVFSRRVLLRLALCALAILILATGAITLLARSVPSFNRYILLVPALKPFRYYPPEQPPPPAPSLPPMPESLRLAKRGVLAVEVTAVADGAATPESDWFAPQFPRELPSLATRTFTGLRAEELVALWDTQLLECSRFGTSCFDPSYVLRFFSADGLIFDTALCWHCGTISLSGNVCRWDSRTPQARQLKQKVRALLPPLSTAREWRLPRSSEGDPSDSPPPSPLSFGSISAGSPEATSFLRRELESRAGELAYCYEKLLTESPWLGGQLVLEFDLAPYTPKEHEVRLARERVQDQEWRKRVNRVLDPLGLSLTTGVRLIEHLTLIRSTVPEPALTECVYERMSRWSLRRYPSPDQAPLHASVTIEFRAPAADHHGG